MFLTSKSRPNAWRKIHRQQRLNWRHQAAFTMFQLSTNDGWAASVVRPILDLDVFGGLLLLLYTWVPWKEKKGNGMA